MMVLPDESGFYRCIMHEKGDSGLRGRKVGVGDARRCGIGGRKTLLGCR